METCANVVTATSMSGKVLEVVISAGRQVRATNGCFLGDVDGMERLGWEFK